MAANPHCVYRPETARTYKLSELDPLFHYHRPPGLDFHERVIQQEPLATVSDISYASPVFGRATGYLVRPAGAGRFPAIVFSHWGLGNATEFLPEALLYAEVGVVSLLVASPWARPRPWNRDLKGRGDGNEDRYAFIQAVVDLRRGFDLLRRQPNVDHDRIAFVGHSAGAQWGAILSAVDKRMKATVLMAGTPDQACIYLDSNEPDVATLREREPLDALLRYLETVGQIDAIHYVGHAAPVPLLFQFARFERYFNETAMLRYYEAASSPKEILWYNTGHDLNDPRALLDRSEWLHRVAGMPQLAPLFIHKLKTGCRRTGRPAGAWLPVADARPVRAARAAAYLR